MSENNDVENLVNDLTARMEQTLQEVRSASRAAAIAQSAAVKLFKDFLSENHDVISDLEENNDEEYDRLQDELSSVAYDLDGRMEGLEFWVNSYC